MDNEMRRPLALEHVDERACPRALPRVIELKSDRAHAVRYALLRQILRDTKHADVTRLSSQASKEIDRVFLREIRLFAATCKAIGGFCVVSELDDEDAYAGMSLPHIAGRDSRS